MKEFTPSWTFSENQPMPLSFEQQRQWFLHQMDKGNVASQCIILTLKLEGILAYDTLNRAIDEIARRHIPLRTTITQVDGKLVQLIHSPNSIELPFLDLSKEEPFDKSSSESKARTCLAKFWEEPFDIEEGPVWRTTLFRLGPRVHWLGISIHRIASDGSSLNILQKELMQLYHSLSLGEDIPLLSLKFQYPDFITRQKNILSGSLAQKKLKYWQEHLKGAPLLHRLPLDYQRPDQQNFTAKIFSSSIDSELTNKLRRFNHVKNASMFMTTLTSFTALLSLHAQQKDWTIGVPFVNRSRIELKPLIGCLTNLLPLRMKWSGDPSWNTLLEKVKLAVWMGFKNQEIPFDYIVRTINPERSLSHTPLVQLIFNLQSFFVTDLTLDGLSITQITDIYHNTQLGFPYDLQCNVHENNDSLDVHWAYNPDLFTETSISLLNSHFETLLRSIVTDNDLPISKLPLFNESEPLNKCDTCIENNGLPLDLDEIESFLIAHPQISEAVVVDAGEKTEEKRIIAYIVPNPDTIDHQSKNYSAIQALTAENLRRTLAKKFPVSMIPNFFIVMDALPLNYDGKVDKKSLPDPYQNRLPLETEYVSPKTDVEVKLAKLWQELLLLECLPGIYDNFFDLGGYSLLSALLVTRIEKVFQCRLSLRQFFSNPTISELADIVDNGNENDSEEEHGTSLPSLRWPLPEELYHSLFSYFGSWQGERATPEALIVGRNTNGKNTPLLWIFQGEQEFSQLARYLGPDQPLYGMRSGHLIISYEEDDVQAMALRYVEEISDLLPDGPLFIGGNCQGAIIALAVAQHFQRRQRTIPLLFLMEWHFPMQPYAGTVALLFGKESENINPYKRFHCPELAWKRSFFNYQVEFISGEHGHFFNEPNIQVLANIIARCIVKAVSTPSLILPEKEKRAKIDILDLQKQFYSNRHYLLPISLSNISTTVWGPTDTSGLTLGNRWLDSKGQILQSQDGRIPLPSLSSGESVQLVLPIKTPEDTGLVELQIALVDEGVSWSCDHKRGEAQVSLELIPAPKSIGCKLTEQDMSYGAPILIGGTDGSGTRFIAQILAEAGIFLGSEKNKSWDSLGMIEPTTSLVPYWNREIPQDVACSIRENLYRILPEFLAPLDTTTHHGKWGWKLPPHVFFTPFFHSIWPDLRCIHIVRDGRDMALSNNQNQLSYLGPVALTSKELPLSQQKSSISLWSRLNTVLANYGELHLFKNYLQVRYEDLVSHPVESIDSLLKFLEIKADAHQLAKLITPSPSIGRYEKESDDTIESLNKLGKEGLLRFGYIDEHSKNYNRY